LGRFILERGQLTYYQKQALASDALEAVYAQNALEAGVQLTEDQGIAAQTELVLYDLKEGVAAQFDGGLNECTVFEPVIVSLNQVENPDNRAMQGLYLDELTTGLGDLVADKDAGQLSPDQVEKADVLISAVLDKHLEGMIRAVEDVSVRWSGGDPAQGARP